MEIKINGKRWIYEPATQDKRWRYSVLDQFESMEIAAEARLDDMTEGCYGDSFVCACGKVAKLSEASQSTPSPFSDPMCRNCAYPEEIK